jgi:hypothetical protein
VTSDLRCLAVPAAQVQNRWRVDVERGAAIAGWARATFLREGDALAAPQRRAEDVFAGILVHAGTRWSIKAG